MPVQLLFLSVKSLIKGDEYVKIVFAVNILSETEILKRNGGIVVHKHNGEKFYITTPIYYPSGNPHIGHCYTTTACDSIARYRRMQGYDVMFLTGTDEHGQKIEQKAAEKGITPKQYVDEIVEIFKNLWSYMNISYDRYIRTTDDYHIESVQKIFKDLYDRGYIYKGEYKGKYCTPCESFWTESQLVDGKCPDCGRPVTDAKEEAYFLKMSPFADRINKSYRACKQFYQART